MPRAAGVLLWTTGCIMSKLDEIRGRTLALWAMLVASDVVKRNTMPFSEVSSLLVLDYAEKDLTGVVEAASEYLKHRKGGVTISVTSRNGITLVSDSNDPDVDEIYAYWVKALNMGPNTQKSAKRIGMIRARLREGFTKEQLKQAIKGLSESEFHLENDYKDLRYALRNDEQVRRMANIKPKDSASVDDIWEKALKGSL